MHNSSFSDCESRAAPSLFFQTKSFRTLKTWVECGWTRAGTRAKRPICLAFTFLLATEMAPSCLFLGPWGCTKHSMKAGVLALCLPPSHSFHVMYSVICLDLSLSVQFSSVTQLCPTLSDPMTTACQASLSITNSQSPHKPMSIERVKPSSHLVVHFTCPQSFPASGSFQMSQPFASGSQSIGVSASKSVLPMNTQDWFPLGWIGWISLQSKGLSRVFPNTTVQKHQLKKKSINASMLSFLYSPTLTSIHDHWKNHSLD